MNITKKRFEQKLNLYFNLVTKDLDIKGYNDLGSNNVRINTVPTNTGFMMTARFYEDGFDLYVSFDSKTKIASYAHKHLSLPMDIIFDSEELTDYELIVYNSISKLTINDEVSIKLEKF